MDRGAAVALLLLVGLSALACAQSQQILCPWASTWRYNDRGVQPPANWADATYSDSTWKEGRGPLGESRWLRPLSRPAHDPPPLAVAVPASSPRHTRLLARSARPWDGFHPVHG